MTHIPQDDHLTAGAWTPCGATSRSVLNARGYYDDPLTTCHILFNRAIELKYRTIIFFIAQ